MKSQMMTDVLTGEVVVINGWEDLEAFTKDGYTIYDPLKKFVLGKGVNYLADIGAEQYYIDWAFKSTIIAFSSVYLQHGLTLISTGREVKNGTIVLRQDRSIKNSKPYTSYEVYKIYANGQIRQATVFERKKSDGKISKYFSHYRLTSPKPVMIAGKPFASLCQTYEGAVFEVLLKYLKKVKKNENV